MRVLSEVVKGLKEEDDAHRAKFREKKVRDSFSQVLYAFEKIAEELSGTQKTGLATWGIDHLQSSLSDFEKMLEERGLGVQTSDSIKYLYDEISYPLAELRKFLKGEVSEVPSRKAASVFAEALNGYFLRLMNIASEIDEEYTE